MPRYQKVSGSYYYPPELTRIIKPLKGNPKIKVIYEPALEYAKGHTVTHHKETHLISILENETQYDALYLYSNTALNRIRNQEFISLDETLFILSALQLTSPATVSIFGALTIGELELLKKVEDVSSKLEA